MSSILDALRKLEAEREAASEAAPEPVDAQSSGTRAEKPSPGHTPAPAGHKGKAVLLLGAFLFGGALVVVSVMITLHMAGGRMAGTVPPPKETSGPVTSGQETQTAALSVPLLQESASASVQPDDPMIPAAVTASVEGALPEPEPAEPEPEPAPPTPEPESGHLSGTPNESAEQPQEEAPPARVEPLAPLPLSPEALAALPLLSESKRRQLGLPDLTINCARLNKDPNKTAWAWINLHKVIVGEEIPGTTAVLVGVDDRGVGLEVSGKRYYLGTRG